MTGVQTCALPISDEVGEERYAEAVGRALLDQASDPAFKALLLSLPSEGDLALLRSPVDPAALHEAREALRIRNEVYLRALKTGDAGVFLRRYPQLFGREAEKAMASGDHPDQVAEDMVADNQNAPAKQKAAAGRRPA